MSQNDPSNDSGDVDLASSVKPVIISNTETGGQVTKKDEELTDHVNSSVTVELESVDLNEGDEQDPEVTLDPPTPSNNSPSSSLRSSKGNKLKRTSLNFLKDKDVHTTTMVAETSTTGLILESRPKDLPAKPGTELKRHQKMYEEMVSKARKKDLKEAKKRLKDEQSRRKKDDVVSSQTSRWNSEILPHWDELKHTKKVQELWWQGLPPGVRGQVWIRAIGNELNLSKELYEISLQRCNKKLSDDGPEDGRPRSGSNGGINKENSIEVIHLDVLRTFPTLSFFQEGGPLYRSLHDVLGAYVCYRPDVGYVQGMSFLAAVLLLNMDAPDSFICLANLLNKSCYNVFFRVDYQLMQPYFGAFDSIMAEILPRIHEHFHSLKFNPEFYLIEWIFTLYTRTLPLDVSCRVWDLFCRDGESFLFRTALGILKMYQAELLDRNSIEEIGQFLGRPSNETSSDQLFANISSIHLNDKKFSQTLAQFTKAS